MMQDFITRLANHLVRPHSPSFESGCIGTKDAVIPVTDGKEVGNRVEGCLPFGFGFRDGGKELCIFKSHSDLVPETLKQMNLILSEKTVGTAGEANGAEGCSPGKQMSVRPHPHL